METVRSGSGIEAQARASQEEHPSQCHFPACFAQNSCFCWRSEVVLSNSAGITNFDVITTFTFMHLADAFIQSDLQCIQVIHFFVSTCVPWESNLKPLHC